MLQRGAEEVAVILLQRFAAARPHLMPANPRRTIKFSTRRSEAIVRSKGGRGCVPVVDDIVERAGVRI